MDNKKLKEERIRLFRDSASFRPVSRIPHFANAVTWKVFDAGHTLDEALVDLAVMKECVVHFLDNYTVDGLMDTGIRNQFTVTEAFGAKGYYYYDSESIGIKDHMLCTVDTLFDYLRDYDRFVWEQVLPEKYGDEWYDRDISVWKKTFGEYLKYTMFIISMASLTSKKYGIPSLAPNNPMTGTINFAAEELMANLLGIKELSTAMRRNASLLKDFVDEWDEKKIDPQIEKVLGSDGPNMKYCFDASVLMLVHNIMNTSQFETFYWPHLEKLLRAYENKGMNARIFAEGSILRFADYFRDFSRGTLTMHIENDGVFDIRRSMPNVAIMGGLTTEILRAEHISDAEEATRMLCDSFGREGGFILSEGRMLSYRNDAYSENYRAICDFMNEGGR